MKKFILLLLFSISSLAHAADFRVNEGFIYWHTSAKGSMSASAEWLGSNNFAIDLDKDTLKDTSNAFYFVALEHPVPFVPNIRLAYTMLDHRGKGSFQYFICDPCTINKGRVDLSHVDISPYYKVVSNRWVSLDLGLTARIFTGSVSGKEIVHNEVNLAQGLSIGSSLKSTYALAYADLQFHVSDTGLSFGTLLNGGGTNKETAVDIDAYLAYASPIGIGITAGYRYLDIEIKSDAILAGSKVKLQTDVQASGPYLGLYLRF